MWRRNGNKYNARKAKSLDGRTYHSALEAQLNSLLMLEERAGKIKILKRQQRVAFWLEGIKICEYWPDFTVQDLTSGEVYWVEAKGMETSDYRIKKNLWLAGGPGRLQVFKGSYKAPILAEEIIPKKLFFAVDKEKIFEKLEVA